MCFKRKTNANTPEESKKILEREFKPSNFEELIDSIQVIKSMGANEMNDKKTALLSMAEWKTPNKKSLDKIKIQCEQDLTSMIGQIDDMSKALKVLLLINTQLEETATQKLSK